GPVHAAAVASELGIGRVLVPDMPGAFSALGLLCTDVTHDYIRSELRDLAALSADHMETCFDDLGQRAAEDLDGEGLSESEASHVREVDLRYAGQGYELRVPLDGLIGPPVGAATLTALAARFHERHAAVHGHAAPDAAVELVSYRLRVIVPMPKLEPEPHALPHGAAAAAEREVVFDGGGAVTTPVYRRDAFAPADPVQGPAVIEQLDATTLVPPGWNVRRDDYGNLVLEHGD
ncbi:MAG: hydantoinase/oxoprolinase family protein, partial [Alphaproteobacteria bacterium]